MPCFALFTLYHHEGDRVVLHAMPVMVLALVVLALAYRYYSAFLAAKVAVIRADAITPAVAHADGQNYHPTSKWVLFGHHFAAISGAGPLIGPVLAIQYGYMPGLIWLLVGVCLAGAVQDMLVLTVSSRTDGKSLAEIARRELGRPAALIASLAILFIVVIALAGLGIIVVKALGGEEAKLPAGTQIIVPRNAMMKTKPSWLSNTSNMWQFEPGCSFRYSADAVPSLRSERFQIRVPTGSMPADDLLARKGLAAVVDQPSAPPPDSLVAKFFWKLAGSPERKIDDWWAQDLPNLAPADLPLKITLPAGCTQVVPGSSWGTFTIACTIPIAMFVGLWMSKLRPGRTVEASLMGGALVLGAVVAGNWVPGSVLEPFFSLTRNQTVLALTTYGFIAAILPVWLLLGPRDYLSSFLKIGTVGMLVIGVLVANPPLQAPEFNETFINGGPTFPGHLFPFVFICVMCGSVSGFHALVAGGTTPKMLASETHIRTIGYGAMLTECLVAVTALIAAACLPPSLYYDINVSVERAPEFASRVQEIERNYGPPDALHQTGASGVEHLNLGTVEEKVGGESLRGRTGGAVTLAVGMSVVFEQAFQTVGVTGDALLKYWYHFAIMFEALFILTTIDAGTRIGRFLLQETLGRVIPRFARPDWWPGAILAAALITGGWGWLIHSGEIDTVWSMFGVCNQLLAVLALALVTTWLVNRGRGWYALVTILPMLWVCTTTLTAGTILITERFPAEIAKGNVVMGRLNIGLTAFVMCTVMAIVFWSTARCLAVVCGFVPVKRE